MNKTIAIMQPYFCPYIGYFQLINAVDEFVVYDNIEFSKKGWMRRNRFLMNGAEKLFSLPVRKDSDYLDVCQRYLGDDSLKDRRKTLAQIRNAYQKAPFLADVFPLLEDIFLHDELNLFKFLFHSLSRICSHLDLRTRFVVSSDVDIDHDLKAQDKVIAICKSQGASRYVNAVGGVDLYDKAEFAEHGIALSFIKSNPIEYRQFDKDFVPWLSIIDVLMFNDTEAVNKHLNDYVLI